MIQVGGTIALARLLSPDDFGIFVTVSLFTTLLGTVGDFGIAGSLIQQQHEPSEHQLASAFTTQAAISLGFASLLLLASVLVSDQVQDSDAVLLLQLLTLALVVTGLRTIPTVLMERDLEFGRLAVAEIAQAAVYYGTAVSLAFLTASVLSFGVAALAASLAAFLLVYMLRPWHPRLAFDRDAVRVMLRFGIPYQGSAVVSFLKDALNPLVIGALLGAGAVGLVNWAATVVTYPLQVLGVLYRLYFPAFSRLRASPDRLRPVAGAVVRWNVALATGAVVPFVLAAHFWTVTIFGSQWAPAVPVAYFIAATVPFAAAAGPGTAILNAHGRSDVVFAFTAGWMVLTWVIGVPAIVLFGPVGYGLASLLVTCTAPLLFAAVRQSVEVPFWRSVAAALLAAGTAWLARATITTVAAFPENSFAEEMVLALIEVIVFAGSWAILQRKVLVDDIGLMRSTRVSDPPATGA
jgi:PST family polysaccharide transporter